MKKLYTPGVPFPFNCLYATKINDIDNVEKALRNAFRASRVNPKREILEIEASRIIAILKLL